MESLLEKVKGPEHSGMDGEKVMDRLQWLKHLSLIFNISLGVVSLQVSSMSITTESFLNTLIENFKYLPLSSYQVYLSSSTVKCLSFRQVFQCFESDFGKLINWDGVMEKLMTIYPYTGEYEEDSICPCSLDLNELVYMSKFNPTTPETEIEPERSKLSILRIPQTPDGRLSSVKQSKACTPTGTNSQDVALRGFFKPIDCDTLETFVINSDWEETSPLSPVSFTNYQLPIGIRTLNLSRCKLTVIPNLEGIQSILCLNLNWNFIQDLENADKLIYLKEMHIAHNRVVELNSLVGFYGLRLVDAAYNRILHFSAISALADVEKLEVLNLVGNQVVKQIGFRYNVKTVLKQVQVLNPKILASYSEYKTFLQQKCKKPLMYMQNK